MKHRSYVPYLFLVPFFTIFVVFNLYPILFSFVISFTDWTGINALHFTGLSNLKRLFLTDAIFLKALGNTALLIAFALPMQFVTGLFLAVAVRDYLPRRLVRSTQLFNFLPYITVPVAIGILFTILFDWQNGPINQILIAFGLSNEAIPWLKMPTTARAVTITLIWWKYFGYFMVILLGAISTIPEEIYEAAKIDGARAWQTLRNITLPMCRPFIKFLITTSIIGGLQTFDEPQQLFSISAGSSMPLGGPERSVLTSVMYLYDVAFQRYEYGYGATLAYVLFAIIFLFTMLYNRLWREEDAL